MCIRLIQLLFFYCYILYNSILIGRPEARFCFSNITSIKIDYYLVYYPLVQLLVHNLFLHFTILATFDFLYNLKYVILIIYILNDTHLKIIITYYYESMRLMIQTRSHMTIFFLIY